ncbi:MAG TPA: hypothetical protein VGR67_14275 [Candidatus Polarisedimenticolia bacterium]|nr:hypothetical protein [Candidatus Polarisedimenticolia bacterium]
MSAMPLTFPIRFDPWYRVLSKIVLLPPSRSTLEVEGGEVRVRMGWAFRARFPRSAIVSVSKLDARPISRGVHGFAGRWLVNGSGQGIVSLELNPRQRAYVMGFPVHLRTLMVSVREPAALARALGHVLREGS